MSLSMKISPSTISASEAQLQHALFYWAAWNVRTYPELKWLYHIPNGMISSRGEGHRMKQQGLKPGVADINLPVARSGFHTLYIEMKSELGKQSKEQKEFEEFVTKEGHAYEICRTWEAGAEILELYLKGLYHL